MRRSLIIVSAVAMIGAGLGILGAAWKSETADGVPAALTPGKIVLIDFGGGDLAAEVLEAPTSNWVKVRFLIMPRRVAALAAG